jgi:hypothetical protein
MPYQGSEAAMIGEGCAARLPGKAARLRGGGKTTSRGEAESDLEIASRKGSSPRRKKQNKLPVFRSGKI